jgi:cytochrome c oxidase assembly protein subunit 15
MIVLALGVSVALEAWDVRGEAVPRDLRLFAALTGAAGGLLLFSGVLATAAGPHSGGEKVPRVWRFEPAVWLHVRATALFGITFLILLAWLAHRASSHLRNALILLGLLVTQMIVGEIQYRTHLPLGVVILHVTLSALVWAAVVVVVTTIWRPSRAGMAA